MQIYKARKKQTLTRRRHFPVLLLLHVLLLKLVRYVCDENVAQVI